MLVSRNTCFVVARTTQYKTAYISSAKECLPWSSLAAKRTQSSIFCKKKVPSLLSSFLAPKTVFSAKRSCLPWSFFSRGLKQRRKPGSFLLQLLCGPHLPCKPKQRASLVLESACPVPSSTWPGMQPFSLFVQRLPQHLSFYLLF